MENSANLIFEKEGFKEISSFSLFNGENEFVFNFSENKLFLDNINMWFFNIFITEKEDIEIKTFDLGRNFWENE